MKKLIIPVLFVSVILALSGCGNRGQKVLAKIGDRVITLEEFDKKIERLPKQYQEILKVQKKKFLDEIIREELLHKEALKSKIDKDPETQEVIAEAKKRILVARLIKNRVQDKAFISEEEIKRYYDEHSEEFMLPERWRASHVLVDTPKEAEEIREKLKQGASFEELAEKRSKDAASKKGGDVGYFSKGQLIPEFEKACFELELGELSDVVKTQFGYHVIKLTDRKSPEVQEFSSVENIIKKDLERKRKTQLLEELIADLQNNTKIAINEELLGGVTAEEPESPEGIEQ